MTDMTTRDELVGHTPGPWRVGDTRYGGAYQLIDHNGSRGFVCEVQAPVVCDRYDEQTRGANARLIAAAPAMFYYIAKKAAEGDEEARALLAEYSITKRTDGSAS